MLTRSSAQERKAAPAPAPAPWIAPAPSAPPSRGFAPSPSLPAHAASTWGRPAPSTADKMTAHLQMRAKDPMAAIQMGRGGRVSALPGEPQPVDPSKVRSQLGPGVKLPAATAQRFSEAYGHDLSDVRLHTSHSMAEGIGARAFTVGKDVVFAPGEHRPGTPEGDRLLGHELAHVVQQSGGEAAMQPKGQSDDAHEREADRAAEQALSGGRVASLSRVGSALQKAPSTDEHEDEEDAEGSLNEETPGVEAAAHEDEEAAEGSVNEDGTPVETEPHGGDESVDTSSLFEDSRTNDADSDADWISSGQPDKGTAPEATPTQLNSNRIRIAVAMLTKLVKAVEAKAKKITKIATTLAKVQEKQRAPGLRASARSSWKSKEKKLEKQLAAAQKKLLPAAARLARAKAMLSDPDFVANAAGALPALEHGAPQRGAPVASGGASPVARLRRATQEWLKDNGLSPGPLLEPIVVTGKREVTVQKPVRKGKKVVGTKPVKVRTWKGDARRDPLSGVFETTDLARKSAYGKTRTVATAVTALFEKVRAELGMGRALTYLGHDYGPFSLDVVLPNVDEVTRLTVVIGGQRQELTRAEFMTKRAQVTQVESLVLASGRVVLEPWDHGWGTMKKQGRLFGFYELGEAIDFFRVLHRVASEGVVVDGVRRRFAWLAIYNDPVLMAAVNAAYGERMISRKDHGPNNLHIHLNVWPTDLLPSDLVPSLRPILLGRPPALKRD